MALLFTARPQTALLFLVLSAGVVVGSGAEPLDAPADASLANSPPLRAGEQVRVRHSGRWSEGLLFDWTSDRVTLTGPGGSEAIALAEVSSIQRAVGKASRGLRGALAGAVIGGLADFREPPSCFDFALDPTPHECSRWGSASLAATGGAVFGGIIGALIRRTVWKPASLGPSPAARSVSDARPQIAPGPRSVLPERERSPFPVSVGQRVRVTHGTRREEGVLLAWTDAAITLGTRVGRVTIDAPTITLIEREKVARRVRMGAIAGFVLGSILTYRSSDICGGGKCDDLVGPLRVGAVTAAIGAGMGYGFPREIWVPVPSEPERTTRPEDEAGRRRDVTLTGLTLQPGREVGFRLRVAW